jgi:hypothetical protein
MCSNIAPDIRIRSQRRDAMPHLPVPEVTPMKSILVPVEHSASLSAQLETAALAAEQFAAHMAGVAPRSDFSNYLIGAGAGVGATIPVALEDLQREEAERIEQARSAFTAFVRDRKIVWDDAATPQAHATATWIEEINSGDAAVAQLARLYDISVLARPTADSPVARRQLLEAVLFESGRPILISPPETRRRASASGSWWPGTAAPRRPAPSASPWHSSPRPNGCWCSASRAAWWTGRAATTCAAC